MMNPTFRASDKNTSSSTSTSSIEHHQFETKDQADTLQSENDKLSSQLKEVIKMNTHWQRYDKQREEYVLKLTRTNQELQDRVKSVEPQVHELTKENASLKDAKHERGNIVVEDDDRPRELIASPHSSEDKTITSLSHQISLLKKRNQELERRKSSKAGEEEKDDQILMLREQINVCVEDFKQERKDRERIHAENGKLLQRLAAAEQRIMANEEQMYVYQEKIKTLQTNSNRHHPVSRPVRMNVFDEPCCYPEDRPRYHSKPSQARNTYRHPYRLDDDLTDFPGDVEVDGEEPQDQTDTGLLIERTHSTTSLHQVNEEEPLECPRCLAVFAINRHADLLAHINKCLQ